jgi:hypothetical protein
MTGRERWGWVVFHEVGRWPLTNVSIVSYKGQNGQEGDIRHFFPNKREAAKAATNFGWRDGEFSRAIMPSLTVSGKPATG